MISNTFPLFFPCLITKQCSHLSLSICGEGELLYGAVPEYSLQHMFINYFILKPPFRAKAWHFPYCIINKWGSKKWRWKASIILERLIWDTCAGNHLFKTQASIEQTWGSYTWAGGLNSLYNQQRKLAFKNVFHLPYFRHLHQDETRYFLEYFSHLTVFQIP